MPRVPLPGELLSGGATAPLRAPVVRPRVGAAGVQIERFGRAVEDVGRVAADIGAQQEADLNNAHATEADNLLASQIEKILKAPQTGYLNQRGRDAATEGSRDRADGAIADEVRRIEGMLQNDIQKGMFGQVAQRRLADATSRMNAHQAQQIEVFAVGQSEARARAAIGGAIDAIRLGEGQRAWDQTTVALLESDNVANILGESQEEIDERRLAVTTALHSGVVDALLSEGRATEAAEYLAELDQDVMREKLDPLKRPGLMQDVQRATLNQTATEMAFGVAGDADAVFQEQFGRNATGSEVLQGGTPILNFRFEEGKINAEEFQAALEQLEGIAARRTRTESAQERQLLIDAQAILSRDHTLGFSDLPVSMQNDLIDAGLDATVKRHADAGRTQNNPAAMARLHGMTDADLRAIPDADTMFMDLTKMGLSQARVDQGMARWRDARGEKLTEDDSILGPAKRIEETAMANHFLTRGDNGRPDDDDPETWARFARIEDEIQNRLSDEEIRTGKEVRGRDLQTIIDEVFAETVLVRVGGFFSGTGGIIFGSDEPVPRAALTPEELRQSFVEFADDVVIPVPVHDDIADNLEKALGVRPTDAQVLEAWTRNGSPQTVAEIKR